MGPNPFLGVVYHWLGGLSSATCYLPYKGIKRWAWEVYWFLQGIVSWIIAPIAIGMALVPELPAILHRSPSRSVALAYMWGALWGFGGLTFGMSVRFLGLALGYAIALGLCMVFGTLMPPIFSGEFGGIVHDHAGQRASGITSASNSRDMESNSSVGGSPHDIPPASRRSMPPPPSIIAACR